jgi:hypothetical protein
MSGKFRVEVGVGRALRKNSQKSCDWVGDNRKCSLNYSQKA